jgi:hypothetical protein
MIALMNGKFVDEYGRTRLLRGVNLGGSSKVPAHPNGATWNRAGFFDHRYVSFVGRPFPLSEADEHFNRLREWGLTFLRFLVTWEAVEHEGPGVYDQEYLDYLARVVEKAGEYGFELFIDPHQDTWSRFSGGDGAPGWTFSAAGMDLTAFDITGAAITHQVHGDPFPSMIWPTNDYKLASATMFTLFFAGNDFAPLVRVDDEPIQEYLQRHFIAAMQQVARHLHGMPHVVGYDSLNEPSSGYIGVKDLSAPMGQLQLGASPTPFQSMVLGEGIAQEVDVWQLGMTGPRKFGVQRIDPAGRRAWLPGRSCIWQEHGVWEVRRDGKPSLQHPDYFSWVGGREVDFNRDYLRPFVNRYARAIREIDPQALIFVESVPHQALPEWGPQDAERIVSAPHWYDAVVLMFKQYLPWLGYDITREKLVIGPWAVRRSFRQQIQRLMDEARARMGAAPTLIGEFGIPFDLQGKQAYRTGDFSQQEGALERSLRAMDQALVGWTIWNYTADNTNQRGDLWNDEDLSIFSRDQQTDPLDINSGGRALKTLVRPYPARVAGEPLRLNFNTRNGVFVFVFRHDPEIRAPTEIFLPRYHYAKGYRVAVSDGRWEADLAQQRLVYWHSSEKRVHWVRITKPPIRRG